MTTNRTSQAVEEMVRRTEMLRKAFPRYDTHDVREVIAVCEKYRRMEKALQAIASGESYMDGAKDEAKDALSFDPLC